MPIETVPATTLQYYLITFDALGNERTEPRGKISDKIAEVLVTEAFTDVFIFSHGWLGDIPAARLQYNHWIGAMTKNEADIEKFKQVRPGFRPLLIGIHWPSMPWGNEKLEDLAVSSELKNSLPIAQMVDRYADRIANTEAAKQALQTIFEEASEDMEPPQLSPQTLEAYEVLNRESTLGSEGVAGAPGDDREPFDPEKIYEVVEDEYGDVSYGDIGLVSFDLSRVLAPLRTLSFWKMKARARSFGETGGFQLLRQLQQAAPETVRFHLMGHSFGCIVVSAMVAGPKGKGTLVRPVNSLSLIQGALSLWSYCLDIPVDRGRPGYFHSIITGKKVSGPIITTHSVHDTAVGKMYPLGAGIVLSDVDFAPGLEDRVLPKYGGLGTFGAAGEGLDAIDMSMLPCDTSYSFEAGKIYNLESSEYICKIPPDAGLGGAHNAIAEPEVAHAVWEAALLGA